MSALNASNNTTLFEVAAQWDEDGRMDKLAAERICNTLDQHGFVVVTELLTAKEADQGLTMVLDTQSDPQRLMSTFASETDNKFKRRDFCPLPCSPAVLDFTSNLCKRFEKVLLEYCGQSRPVLEIATLASYFGSSHQYIHRDPGGVICLFVALDDISAEQGGTVFIPATHQYSGYELGFNGAAAQLMELYRISCNWKVFKHNLRKLFNLYKNKQLAKGELRTRLFSVAHDCHQPNLLRFLTARNSQFHLFKIGPRTLWQLFRHHAMLNKNFRAVQCAPAKGSAIIYRSDILHAGPDNNTKTPRSYFGLSIARDIIYPELQHKGYSPHPSLAASPKTLGDLLSKI